MKNDITDILFKYTTGEATLEETNEALKEAEAGFRLEPGKNEITPEEAAQTVTGETPEEVTGYGLLDTGTGSMEKVKIVNGKLGDAINQVNPDGTTKVLDLIPPPPFALAPPPLPQKQPEKEAISLRRGKKPTRKQKIRLGQAGLSPESWLVVKQKQNGELVILHKHTDTIRVVPPLGQ